MTERFWTAARSMIGFSDDDPRIQNQKNQSRLRNSNNPSALPGRPGSSAHVPLSLGNNPKFGTHPHPLPFSRQYMQRLPPRRFVELAPRLFALSEGCSAEWTEYVGAAGTVAHLEDRQAPERAGRSQGSAEKKLECYCSWRAGSSAAPYKGEREGTQHDSPASITDSFLGRGN